MRPGGEGRRDSSLYGRVKALFTANSLGSKIVAIFENVRKQMDRLHLTFEVARSSCFRSRKGCTRLRKT